MHALLSPRKRLPRCIVGRYSEERIWANGLLVVTVVVNQAAVSDNLPLSFRQSAGGSGEVGHGAVSLYSVGIEGSVVTSGGYSDWATTEIPANINSMWYRFSRREDDFCLECSENGVRFRQMRICHMAKATGEIQFGIYACSPEESSFQAVFTNMEVTQCQWLPHDGQAPDEADLP